jgi:hypothetical protein
MLLPVLDKRRFEYSFLGGGASQEITLQPAIDVCGHVSGILFVRVHERNMTSGQSIGLGLYYTLPSGDDPREFTASSSLTDVTITSVSPSSTPALLFREFSSPGAFLKLVLTATQTSVPSTLYAEVSAELLLLKP